MERLKGQLLISSGGLYDPNFRHTVVLIGEHNAEGALGVILNRALDVTIEQAVPALTSFVSPGANLYEGGPVQRTSPVMIAELSRPDLADILIFGRIGFLTGDVAAEVRPHILRARIFAGYSGWGAGQLEAEMATDSWIVEPPLEDDVFTDQPDLLWSRVIARKGPQFHRLSRMPYDPSMN